MKKWSAEDRLEVAGMLRDGLTGRQMGTHFGTSRDAVIGLVHRDPALKAIGFKTLPGRAGIGGVRRAAPVIPLHVPTALECRAVPLLEIEAGECKWPVNDAAPGEMHLFCGLPADGSYCPGHAYLSVGQGTPSERRAHREFRRAA